MFNGSVTMGGEISSSDAADAADAADSMKPLLESLDKMSRLKTSAFDECISANGGRDRVGGASNFTALRGLVLSAVF